MKKSIAAVLCCGILMLGSGCGVQTPPQASAQDSAGTAFPYEESAGDALLVLETTAVDNEEYYLIATEEDLQAIGKQYPLSGSYILNNDITLSDEWMPIGSPDEPFTGIFDGNGYIIYNLTVTKKTDHMGFFGGAKGAVIKDVILENANLVSFFPVAYYAKDTEITGCSINDKNRIQSDPQESGPLSDNNSGTIIDHVEKERTAGRVLLDTVEFSCDIEYELSYVVSSENLTVSQRDQVLENIHDQMQEYIDNADEQFLTSAEAGNTIEEQLLSIINENLIEGMSISGTLTNISVLDDSGEYQTVFPE